jgi:hypothetical protein
MVLVKYNSIGYNIFLLDVTIPLTERGIYIEKMDNIYHCTLITRLLSNNKVHTRVSCLFVEF